MGPGGSCSPSTCSSATSAPSGGAASSAGSGGTSAAGGAGASPSGGGSSPAGSPAAATGAGHTVSKLQAIEASINAADRRLRAALVKLARNPHNGTARRQAVAALGTEVRDLAELKRVVVNTRPRLFGAAEQKRVLGALTSLDQILRAEQHALASHGVRGLVAALRVARRDAAKERQALKILAAAP
jgi:hypothetical protein